MPTYTGFAKDGGVTRVTEREMARMFYASGADGAVMRTQDFAVSAIGGSRRVSVALGTLAVCGVLVTRDTVADIALLDVPQPPSGKSQWYLLVARTSWYSRQLTFEWLPGLIDAPMTATTMPVRPPAALPPMQRDPGLVFDVPLYWVWSSFAFTALRLVDLRKLPRGRPVQFATTSKRVRLRKEDAGAGPSNAVGTATPVLTHTFPDMPPGTYDLTPTWVVAGSPATIGIVQVVGNGTVLDGPFVCHFTPDPLSHSTTRTLQHPGGGLSVDLLLSTGTGGAVYEDGTQMVVTPHPW